MAPGGQYDGVYRIDYGGVTNVAVAPFPIVVFADIGRVLTDDRQMAQRCGAVYRASGALLNSSRAVGSGDTLYRGMEVSIRLSREGFKTITSRSSARAEIVRAALSCAA